MLKTLTINNLTIIDNITINFDLGFNVITGETGAGKSVLIKALGLILGNKANIELIKNKAQPASVIAEFIFPKTHPSYDMLKELDIPLENIDEQMFDLTIRRSIHTNGKTNAWINDIAVTISTLKNLSINLVDIFAQNESFKLQDTSEHINFLDKFIDNLNTKQQFNTLYKKFINKITQIRTLIENYNNKKLSEDYLRFRLEEFNRINPNKQEYLELLQKQQQILSLKKNKNVIDKISHILEKGSYTNESLSKQLWNIVKTLKEIESNNLKISNLILQAESIARNLDDFSFEFFKTFSFDNFQDYDQTLEYIESRISDYNSMLRKFNVNDINELLNKKDELHNQIKNIENIKIQIIDTVNNCQQISQQLIIKANELSQQRKQAAQKLKKLIETELEELAMPYTKFKVNIQDVYKSTLEPLNLELFKDENKLINKIANILDTICSIDKNGKDKIEFLIATNKNSDFHPIYKIASGGELSRIMLALKKSMSEGAETCVLIFDEIDTGISGKTANVVGKKLKDLSKKFQVICISHLAQVSAYANKHFKAEKDITHNEVKFILKDLSKDESIIEIARLLSGEKITQAGITNAKELVSHALQYNQHNK